MSEINIDIIASLMRNTNIVEGGVSFKGEKLELNKEEDCKRIIDAIGKCENLEYFNLEGNTLGVEGSKAVAKALQSKPELKRALWKDIFTRRTKEEIPQALTFAGCTITKLIRTPRGVKPEEVVNLGNGLKLAGAQLTELDMSDNAFGPIGLEKLAGLLSSPTCYQLQVLKLDNNGLGIYGGKMLADALLCCHERSVKEGKPFALKVFIAGRNRLENEGATAIAKVFKTLGSLEEVVLPQNGIYSKGIEALSKSFIGNKNLMVLNLNDNMLGKNGALSIAKALPHLQKLKVLNLGDCLLKSDGAEVVANALREKHTNLEELYMCSNEINKVGGLAIAEAVKNKDKLKVLSLNGNSFGVKGCECVRMKMEEIKRISCLQSLSDDEGEEDNDSDEKEGDCNEVSDGNESENDRSSEMSELSFNSANFTCTPKLENEETDSLRHTFQHLSFNQNDMDSLNKFLNLPVIDNFKGIDKKVVENYVQMAQTSKEDSYSDKIMELVMKISQFSSCPEDKVKTLASEISYDLYKNLFSWAKDNNQTSAVTNSLMVYLGLIKSEDKKFRIDWKTEGCLSVLEGAISKSILPESTKEILRCCMNREKTVTLTK